MVELLLGKDIAKSIKAEVAQSAQELKDKYQVTPALCAIQVGGNQESEHYIDSQRKLAEKLSINHMVKELPENVTEKQIIQLIKNLNDDSNTNGIILQMPLPGHLDETRIRGFIRSNKDVEGVHPKNLGKVMLGTWKIAPCTACAVMELLKSTQVDLYGKEVVIVGHSQIVGRPLSVMLMQEMSTVTVCHIATSERGNLKVHIKNAEILVVAAGKPNLIKGEWVKPGAVVIDVGFNKLEDKIVGDVEFETAKNIAGIITPVPGGVGPLTVAILMRNLINAVKLQLNGTI
ncbi:MAG: bifunctional 5,10-methylenetetrahydrofolate dehydrogenase/5,10-methenyltetrahydrofolate cyclohydrolase [PVC group bacterium]|nr:bifunctional 5,10-methylenetetrahydrofolate dehydrogenase/5,10-methenyltetrahydrofolate cyclohydrolase [PVC group bacterium]